VEFPTVDLGEYEVSDGLALDDAIVGHGS
jgi:hypothetical protein